MEPLRNLYEGIFTKTFTLFYGETLHYYFKAELGEKTWQTQELSLIHISSLAPTMSMYGTLARRASRIL